ncbi:MAG: hypothetical protein JWR50_4064 [Mucilaginibacter sp.]|nr:hypothetical protein [Mucilaginibacter sp.]
MKRAVFLAAGCFLFSVAAMAQKVKSSLVPAPVTAALTSKYPTATKVTWEKEKGNFEANWGGKSGEDMSVMFSPAGTFIEQVKAIKVSELPAGVDKYVKDKYNGAKITEAGKVTDAAGKTMYEAEVKGKDMVFDEQGNFLKID